MSYDALRLDPRANDFFQNPVNGGPDHARPRFYQDAVLDTAESEKQGCAIYVNREFVEIRHPGDRSYSWLGEVQDEHRRRWPDHYKAFKESAGASMVGTPIEKWPPLTPADVANLKAIHIHSVEDLATTPDSALNALGHGGRTLRDKAAAWLEAAAKGAAGVQAAAENARLKEQLEALQKQVSDMANATKGRRRQTEDAEA